MNRPLLAWVSLALWLSAHSGFAEAPVQASDEGERALAQETRLELVERIALAQNPGLAEASARSAASRERASGATRLADPEFKYEQWAVPLRRPYALDRADTLMFGLRQALPVPGARAVQARMAGEEVRIGEHERQALARELLLRVRRAYFEYVAAERALLLQGEHLEVAEQIVQQVRAEYEAGRGQQEDVLKVLVELSRLHNELSDLTQERASARLMLNALMARAPDAALGPPAQRAPPSELPALRELDRQRKARPELSAAERAVRRSQATLEAAHIAARRPSFMVGADYWLMPQHDTPHAYGAMLTMSLPWFSAGRRADVREAEQLVGAQRQAARAVETATRFELHDALARLEAAQRSLTQIEGGVLPQAEQSLAATRSAFALGRTSLLALLDALRAYFQIRLEHSRAASRVMAQRAQVEFAAGSALPITEAQP